MKKRKIVLFIILVIIGMLILNKNVYATSVGIITIKGSKRNVKAGDTFTITIHASCDDGINGLTANYEYDEDKLELTDAKVANSNWSSLGGEKEIALIATSATDITSDDMYTLTFKVKSNVKSGDTINFSIKNTTLSVFSHDGSDINIGDKTVTLNVSESTTVDPSPDPEPDPEPEPTPTPDPEPNPTPEPEPTPEPTPSPEPDNKSDVDNRNDNKVDNKKEEITKQPGENKEKDTTTATTNYPYTGEKTIIFISILIAIAVISALLYKKYKNIQIK